MAKRKKNEIDLDQKQANQIYEVFTNVSAFSVAEDTFMSIVLSHGASVSMPKFKIAESKELKDLLQNEYIKWKGNMYRWLKMFGIYPWRLVYIKDSPHSYPEGLVYDSGYMTTYPDKKHRQQFRWYWHDRKHHDHNVQFVTHRNLPTLKGKYTTPIVGLINDYILLQKAQYSVAEMWQDQVNPKYVLEHAKIHNGSDWGATKLGSASATNRALGLNSLSVNRRVLLNTWERVQLKNHPELKELRPIVDAAERVPTGFTLKRLESPKLNVDLIVMSRNLEEKASAIMDFKVDTNQFKKTNVQSDNYLRFLNERVKAWLTFFENQTGNVVKMVYATEITKSFAKIDRFEGIDLDLVVSMPCTPFTTLQDLETIWGHNIISQESFFKHAGRGIGIPENELNLVDE